MTDAVWKQNTCVVCDAETRPLLDLGTQPLANILLCDAGQPYQSFPLGLDVCGSAGCRPICPGCSGETMRSSAGWRCSPARGS